MINPKSVNLRAIARGVMQQYGFLVDVPPEAAQEAARAKEPAFPVTGVRDLSDWLWSSIDNDDSRDLDQIEFAKQEPGGIRICVAIAQVDPFVPKDSALDAAAQHNTTSIYTGVQTFPMLPERLSTDLSSLNENQKRLAVVFELVVSPAGDVSDSSVYPAVVQNKAQLTYDAVAVWLEAGGKAPADASSITLQMLEKIRANPGLPDQLALQDKAAQALRQRRHEAGALTLTSIEFRPVIATDGSIALDSHTNNRATQLIEDFMVASNQDSVRYLLMKQFPTLRRVVRTPKRWDRIAQLAQSYGDTLPAEPDAQALEGFLQRRQKQDPDRFPDLSLTIIKLLGRGEYVINVPGQPADGHFSLAVENYSHSTAPNRRYPDILTQRLLLAAFANHPVPYTISELQGLAAHCTEKEDDANKVERSVRKSIAAVALANRIGQEFSGYVTGASDKGVWIRVVSPPVEGKLIGQLPKLDVGDKVTARLVETNPERGYIDFQLISRS